MNANDATRKRARAGNAEAAARGPVNTSAILAGAPGTASNHGTAGIPRKWAKHYRDLLSLRAHFEAELRGHALAARQPPETFSLSMADAATDEFDRVLALSALSAEQDALREIDEALNRIKTGAYGICEVTRKPIPVARLNALPWTRFAGVVEQQLEREGKANNMRLGELRSVTGSATADLGEADIGEEASIPPACDETLSRVPASQGAGSTHKKRRDLMKGESSVTRVGSIS